MKVSVKTIDRQIIIYVTVYNCKDFHFLLWRIFAMVRVYKKNKNVDSGTGFTQG